MNDEGGMEDKQILRAALEEHLGPEGSSRLSAVEASLGALGRWLTNRAGWGPLTPAIARRWMQAWELLEKQQRAGQPVSIETVNAVSDVVALGDYPLRTIRRRPEIIPWLVENAEEGLPWSYQELEDDFELQAWLSKSTSEARRHLRQFRHRHHLRIFLRELSDAPLREVVAEVSDVAALSVEAVLQWVTHRRGQPKACQHLSVLAMGKLGGRELNYSSDIDLVVVASDEVDAQGLAELEAVFREVISELEARTEDGSPYRIDMRLRPEGSRGRLVTTAGGTVDYYLHQGRTWERGAWLKARPVAGNRALGESVIEALEPFLYRRYLDYEAIDELRRMKELIDRQSQASEALRAPRPHREPDGGSEPSALQRRLRAKFQGMSTSTSRGSVRPEPPSEQEVGWDIKRGVGGIREIEFFVQALQLIHCGQRPELRVASTLEALDRLLYSGLLDQSDQHRLADAYDLFRRLEHRLQLREDLQTHRLPPWDNRQDWQELALVFGEGIQERVKAHRSEVRAIFERLFEASERRPSEPTVPQATSPLATLVALEAGELSDPPALDLLRESGFQRPRQAAGQLQVLRQKRRGPFSTNPATARPGFAEFLLEAVRQAPDPEGALGYLVRFSTAIGDSPATWDLLAGQRHAARLLIYLFGSSPPMARLLAEEPELFERLVYRDSVTFERSRAELAKQLNERLQGISNRARRLGRLRRFEREEGVRIALHEVAGQVELETTCRQWSDIAELGVETRFREVVDEFATAQGLDIPPGDPVTTLPLSVVAMGKLGSRELGIGGDLDLLFIYDDDKSIDQATATRLARRLVRVLGMPGGLGEGYAIDLRLRPSGGAGRLVVSTSSWDEYYQQRADVWEHQALLKARPLTGSEQLRTAIEEVRHRHCFQKELPHDLRTRIADMRDSLRRAAIEERGAEPFDIKAHRGGLLDIEFLVQWVQLSRREVAIQGRSTTAILEALATEEPWAGLRRDYRWLRRLELRLGIAGRSHQLPDDRRQRESLARQIGFQGRDVVAQLNAHLQQLRRRVARTWDQVMEGGEGAR